MKVVQSFVVRARISLSLCGDQSLCATQIYAYQLRHAALGHGDAKQAIHTGHGDGMMGNNNKAGFRSLPHFIQKAAVPIDVRIVQGRVNFVQDADG